MIELETSMVKSCIKSQRKMPSNKNFSDEVIKDYCECLSRKTSQDSTYKELEYFAKHNKFNKTANQKYKRNSVECRDYAFEKGGLK